MKACKQLEANTDGSQLDSDSNSDHESDHRNEIDAEESDPTYEPDNTDSNSSHDKVLYAQSMLSSKLYLLPAAANAATCTLHVRCMKNCIVCLSVVLQ